MDCNDVMYRNLSVGLRAPGRSLFAPRKKPIISTHTMTQESFPAASHLHRKDGVLHIEGVPLNAIADALGTPTYIYSRSAIEQNWNAFDRAFGARDHQVCYAVKANSNIAILHLLSKIGSGFDIVSGGELARALKAGVNPAKIFFSGVGKTADEIDQSLSAGIGCFNIESPAELELLESRASATHTKVSVAVRVNPNVDAHTHPHITTGRYSDKFGVALDAANALYERIAQSAVLNAHGVDCHIGSQITDPSIYAQALQQVVAFADDLRSQGHPIKHLNIGGGFAICYDEQAVPTAEDYVAVVERTIGKRDYQIIVEPGRFIVGNAGVLLTRALLLKSTPEKNFIVVDAAMNDLIRPALYQASHRVVAVHTQAQSPSDYDIVGPVCESGDTLARDCSIAAQAGDLLAVLSAGAYGFSMASNYNSRPRAAEVVIHQETWQVVRTRESIDDLMQGESLLS